TGAPARPRRRRPRGPRRPRPGPPSPQSDAPRPMWHAPTVAEFDAELYLRLSGERMLLERGDRGGAPWESPLMEAARALIAVGAIDAERARAVIDDYDLASALRSHHGMHQRAMWRQHHKA